MASDIYSLAMNEYPNHPTISWTIVLKQRRLVLAGASGSTTA
jgi:hypothetical protein